MNVFTEFLPGSGADASQYAMSLQSGIDANHEGLALAKQGDHAGAARAHRRALAHKLAHIGPGNITTAVSYNALGEALMHLGQLDEAEENIKKALEIAINVRSNSDEGFYRENLAMVYETRGDLELAKTTRLQNAPNKHVCSYYQCQPLQLRSLKELSRCQTCKSILYCSKACQLGDWKRHKKYCKKME